MCGYGLFKGRLFNYIFYFIGFFIFSVVIFLIFYSWIISFYISLVWGRGRGRGRGRGVEGCIILNYRLLLIINCNYGGDYESEGIRWVVIYGVKGGGRVVIFVFLNFWEVFGF